MLAWPDPSAWCPSNTCYQSEQRSQRERSSSCWLRLARNGILSLRSLSALQAAPLIKSIPKEAYGALPFALAPLLSNPIAMAANKALGAKSPFEAVQKIGQGMLDMLPGLGKLAEILPQDTLLWKLRLLAEGCRYMDTRYHMVCPVHFQHLYATRPRLRCMPVTFAS